MPASTRTSSSRTRETLMLTVSWYHMSSMVDVKALRSPRQLCAYQSVTARLCFRSKSFTDSGSSSGSSSPVSTARFSLAVLRRGRPNAARRSRSMAQTCGGHACGSEAFVCLAKWRSSWLASGEA